jgi:hypothetical protein
MALSLLASIFIVPPPVPDLFIDFGEAGISTPDQLCGGNPLRFTPAVEGVFQYAPGTGSLARGHPRFGYPRTDLMLRHSQGT